MTSRSHINPRQNLKRENDRAGRLSRRDFLNGAGIAAAAGLAAAGGSLVVGRNARASDEPEAPPLPWKYKKLDPVEAGKRGYENYLLHGG